MVVDSSAIIAILEQEPESEIYAGALEATESCLISAASVVEAGIVVIRRHGADALEDLKALLDDSGLQIEAVTAEQVWVAPDLVDDASAQKPGWNISSNYFGSATDHIVCGDQLCITPEGGEDPTNVGKAD